MALIGRLDDERLPVFYNVTMAVGRGCPNRRDDVLLVQYMLDYIYHRAPGGVRPPTPRPLTLDGLCGPTTVAYILGFQKDVNRLGNHAVSRVDGRVDPARGMESAISHTVYTIIHLNAAFKKRYRGNFDDLPNDPTVPAILRGSLGGSTYATGVID